jgi:2-polyprenyl-6-methoxyphenol hydroxylase-like FAD-dependent oxidoreductase
MTFVNQDVLIIGARPVGLTLAIQLARCGVPVRIVEKAAQRTEAGMDGPLGAGSYVSTPRFRGYGRTPTR